MQVVESWMFETAVPELAMARKSALPEACSKNAPCWKLVILMFVTSEPSLPLRVMTR
jgi:hypothetical protein